MDRNICSNQLFHKYHVDYLYAPNLVFNTFFVQTPKIINYYTITEMITTIPQLLLLNMMDINLPIKKLFSLFYIIKIVNINVSSFLTISLHIVNQIRFFLTLPSSSIFHIQHLHFQTTLSFLWEYAVFSLDVLNCNVQNVNNKKCFRTH